MMRMLIITVKVHPNYEEREEGELEREGETDLLTARWNSGMKGKEGEVTR